MRRGEPNLPGGESGQLADKRFEAILVEYMRAVDQGAEFPWDQHVEEFPDLRSQLERFLSNDRLLRDLGEQPEARVSSDAPAPLGAGARVGNYEINAPIARGGMGLVYRATDLRLKRPVALKTIIGARIASSDDLQRFRLEAESIAQLDHPSIVPILDVGELDGRHYFTMKLLEGGDLSAHLERLWKQPVEARRA